MLYKFPVALLGCALGASQAFGGTIDFTDAAFASTFPAVGDQSVAMVEVDGVNFTIAADARGTDGFRQSFDDAGLSFGVPGNGMNFIDIVADEDVTFTSLVGEDRTLLNRSSAAQFNLLVDGAFIVTELGFPTSFANVDFADIAVDAGETFRIAFSFEARPDFNAIFANAVLGSLDFETAAVQPPAVPLPAGLPLMLAGFGAFAWMRRKG